MGIYSIIDNRAWNSLKLVTDQFNTYTTVTRTDINRIELDAEKIGIKSMYSSYKVMNKWMGRVYIFKWHCFIEDSTPPHNQSMKLQYRGKLFGEKIPEFTSNNELAIKLNKDPEIMKICKAIDFEKLELSYSKRDKGWNIEIWPNYGDFIWMLIPPVRYFRKPNDVEIQQTIQLVQRIRDVFTS